MALAISINPLLVIRQDGGFQCNVLLELALGEVAQDTAGTLLPLTHGTNGDQGVPGLLQILRMTATKVMRAKLMGLGHLIVQPPRRPQSHGGQVRHH